MDIALGPDYEYPLRQSMGGATGECGGTLSPHFWDPRGGTGGTMKIVPPLLGPGGTGRYYENDLTSD